MKNPQKYKEYYKSFNKLKNDIIEEIKNMISNKSYNEAIYNSIAFNEPFLSTCILDVVDEDEDVVVWGLSLGEKDEIIVHAGIYEPNMKYDARQLNMGRLIRLYKILEEAIHEYPYEPFQE